MKMQAKAAAMQPATPKTQLQSSTQLRKVAFAGSHTCKLKLKSSTRLAIALVALAISGSPCWTNAETFISGAITTTTTTWTPSGNPYKIIGNCSVASGQVLTIQPGVVVIIFAGLNMDVYGQILAQGSPAARITFQGLTPANYWNRLYIQKGSTVPDSWFSYCNFSEATNAIYLEGGVFNTVATKVLNSTFTNCVVSSVYGYAADGINLTPMITNCLFIEPRSVKKADSYQLT